MKLSQCTKGKIVCMTDDDKAIGHIVGLAKNACREVIPTVHFVGDELPKAIHNGNIVELNDKDFEG